MPEEKGPDENKPKWTVTLGGGEWGTVRYGIVEYLRKHPRMRAATAIFGLVWTLGWLASTGGYHWNFMLLPTMSALFMTPTLLWFAVVSGPEFCLAFGETKTPVAPAPPPSTNTNAVLDPEGYGMEALNKSFISTEACGRGSFRWAMFALIAGIVFGSLDVLLSTGALKVSVDHSLIVIICAFAGTMFLLCAILLLRSMIYFRRTAAIHDRLLDLQKIITAIKFLERTKEAPVSVDPAFVFTKLLSPSRDLAA